MADKKAMTLFNYIGGKTWMREHLRQAITPLLKPEVNTYIEPFAGGLGAFLGIYDILLEQGIKNVVLNDINGKLINFYKVVQNNKEALMSSYAQLEKEYKATIPLETQNLHKTKDKEQLKVLLEEAQKFYNKVRDTYNTTQDNVESAVALLFLQNHCFNGVYRENSKGFYNTPFNWESKSFQEEKVNEKIKRVNEIFKKFNIDFTSQSFEGFSYEKNALYYLDPPYINDVEALENQYHKDSFNVAKQKQLIQKLKNIHFLYSNHDNDILIQEFNNNDMKINVKKIPRKNIISASNESRKNDKIEILVSSNN